MANHYLDLLIACCNRGQTSDIHGTFQVFVAMASWQNVEACMLVPITMYRTITHSLGLSLSLSLDFYWSPILGYIQRNHVLIDIFSHRCGWLLIFKQEDDWLIYSSCIQATHPQWSIFIEEKKNIWKRLRYWNYWGFQFERYILHLIVPELWRSYYQQRMINARSFLSCIIPYTGMLYSWHFDNIRTVTF